MKGCGTGCGASSQWLESKSYRMHIRVLLSKYRAYDACPACGGARLKPEALLWRLGAKKRPMRCSPPAGRFRPRRNRTFGEDLRRPCRG